MSQQGIESSEATTADGLRASYDVMIALEKCKSSSEYILDALPEFFAIMTGDGRILKGNFESASHYGKNYETVIGDNIFDLFEDSAKKILKDKLSNLSSSNHQTMFELSMRDSEGQIREFFWTISIFDQVSDRRGTLYRVLGRDISEIKAFEKRLSQIFSAIPLGIITVLGTGEVEWPYSQFTEYLLGKKNLAGKKIDDLLFKPIWDHLDSVERMGASQLIECIGGDPMWFEMSKLHFPKEVSFEREVEGEEPPVLWLGLNYHPIVNDNIIEKVMIVIEDKTEIIKAKKALEIQRHIEDSKVKKILEIQQCSGSLLQATFGDFSKLIPKLHDEIDAKDYRKLARTLHALKGIARTAGFTGLKDAFHELEDQVVDKIKNDIQVDQEKIERLQATIAQEWKEMRSLVFALSGKTKNIQIQLDSFQEISKELDDLAKELDGESVKLIETVMSKLGVGKFLKPVELASLEERLKVQVEKLNKVYPDKNFHLMCQWNEMKVSSGEISTFNEIFLHLLNNAVDHGLETIPVREAAGKDGIGMIYLKLEDVSDGVQVIFSDDGGGIHKAKVLQAAQDNGLVKPDKASSLSEEAVFELLFHPGFSSKDEVNDISGRGIGLDSVLDAVKTLGSSGIKVTSEEGKGTTFKFLLPHSIKMD